MSINLIVSRLKSTLNKVNVFNKTNKVLRIFSVYSIVMLFIGFLPITSYAQQPSEITEKYFKDPDISFNTPTLSLKGERFATYEEISDWINEKISINEFAEVKNVGKTPKGEAIRVIYLSKPGGGKKTKIWMQGALHGNEPAGGEALLYLADQILNKPGGDTLLNQVSIALLPIANVDGYSAMKRRSSLGYDLNRDQTKFADSVSVFIKKAFIDWSPDLAIDFHEFRPTRAAYADFGNKGYTYSYDVKFLSTGYPNVPKELRNASQNIFMKDVYKTLDENNYTHNFYFSTDTSDDEIVLKRGARSPHSSSTSFALSNAVSMLVELRGIGIGLTSYARRVHSGWLVADQFIRSAIAHKGELNEAIDAARSKTINLQNDIVVTEEPTEDTSYVKFIDLETAELVKMRMKVANSENMAPGIVRKRPFAYIIEKESARELEILRLLGLKIDTLESSTEVEVESYWIKSMSLSSSLFEKIRKAEVSTEVIRQTKTFPAGTLYLDLAQKNANYAVSLLEPETMNGFVSYRVTNTSPGDTLKYHRVMNEKLIIK